MDPLSELAGLPAMRQRESLADSVYFALRDAIANGVLQAGFRLREAALSKHFGVSSTPVREALRRLEREGLVELSLYRGATVAQFHPERWTDLWDVRVLLAVHAVRRAALAPERDFSQVERQLELEAEVLAGPGPVHFGPVDIAFHRALNELSGNPLLAELTEMIQWRTQGMRIRYAEQLQRPPEISHAQHIEIVEAVRERDADRAAALMREHNTEVEESTLNMLDQASG
jgi:DNA-binding GntR family transcriptional regulator